MAFIRWKTNRNGLRYGYLVESYRDEQGKVRHRHLGYVGKEGQITSKHIAHLRNKHASKGIAWDSIPPATHPARTDISTLSDQELLSRLEPLRLERGLSSTQMVKALIAAGLTPKQWRHGPHHMSARNYRYIEEKLGEGGCQYLLDYVNSQEELCVCVRKVFSM